MKDPGEAVTYGYGPYDPEASGNAPLNAWQLAERDGPFCWLCGCDVDMDSRLPDQMSPSVDHVVPLTRGGLNDSTNLQLTHLCCNRAKGNRSSASLREVVVP